MGKQLATAAWSLGSKALPISRNQHLSNRPHSRPSSPLEAALNIDKRGHVVKEMCVIISASLIKSKLVNGPGLTDF